MNTTLLPQGPHARRSATSPRSPAAPYSDSFSDPATDPVQALRCATQQLHEQLDRCLPLARVDASLADYVLHLVVLRDWQQALAPWLVRTGRDFSALERIAEDLADGPPVAVFLKPVDLSAVRGADDGSVAFCWGMAYVLEGSRLGGQVLYRRLKDRLAPHPLRYLGQRAAHGEPWGETLVALRRALNTEPARRAGCAGAVAAFETLLRRFDEAGCLT